RMGQKPKLVDGCHDSGSGGTPGSGGSSASVRLSRLALWSLHAETVKFPVAYASEECVPFIRRESQNCPFGFPAVTDPDLATRQASYLDTVAVGETQRTFDPVETRIFRVSERSASHRTTSLIGVCVRSAYMATDRSGFATYSSHSTLRLTDNNGGS